MTAMAEFVARGPVRQPRHRWLSNAVAPTPAALGPSGRSTSRPRNILASSAHGHGAGRKVFLGTDLISVGKSLFTEPNADLISVMEAGSGVIPIPYAVEAPILFQKRNGEPPARTFASKRFERPATMPAPAIPCACNRPVRGHCESCTSQLQGALCVDIVSVFGILWRPADRIDMSAGGAWDRAVVRAKKFRRSGGCSTRQRTGCGATRRHSIRVNWWR